VNVRTALTLWCPDFSRTRRARIIQRGLGPVPIYFDGDLRTTLGVAYGTADEPDKAFITLNPKLLLEEVYHVRLIFLHEVAHLLASCPGHGPEWQLEALRLGVPPVAEYPFHAHLRHVPLRIGRVG
jgi:hypothetical protein